MPRPSGGWGTSPPTRTPSGTGSARPPTRRPACPRARAGRTCRGWSRGWPAGMRRIGGAAGRVRGGELRAGVVMRNIGEGGGVTGRGPRPYRRGGHRRYVADGLVIVGIHCPEFAFEQDPAIVREFIAAQRLPYRVVADNA